MPKAVLEILIPTRFMLTLGHLVCVLMIAYTKHENFRATLPSDPGEDRMDEAKQEASLFLLIFRFCSCRSLR